MPSHAGPGIPFRMFRTICPCLLSREICGSNSISQALGKPGFNGAAADVPEVHPESGESAGA